MSVSTSTTSSKSCIAASIAGSRAALSIAANSPTTSRAASSISTTLTDNGSEFTDRFAVDKKGKPEGKPSGHHPFDNRCRANAIEHRLTKPFHPQTNGMVERFNRRLAEAMRNHPAAGTNRGKNKFISHHQRNAFLHRVVTAYNLTRLQCLRYLYPAEVLHNHTEGNTKVGEALGWFENGLGALASSLSLYRRRPVSTVSMDSGFRRRGALFDGG